MSDRCNVAIRVDPEDVQHIFIYARFLGESLPSILKNILVESFVYKDDNMGLANYLVKRIGGDGLSLSVFDNDRPVFEVDIPDRKVRIFAFQNGNVNWNDKLAEFTFDEYVQIEKPDYENLI